MLEKSCILGHTHGSLLVIGRPTLKISYFSCSAREVSSEEVEFEVLKRHIGSASLIDWDLKFDRLEIINKIENNDSCIPKYMNKKKSDQYCDQTLSVFYVVICIEVNLTKLRRSQSVSRKILFSSVCKNIKRILWGSVLSSILFHIIPVLILKLYL